MKIAIFGASSVIAKDLILSFSRFSEDYFLLFSRKIERLECWESYKSLGNNFKIFDYSEFKNCSCDVIINFIGKNKDINFIGRFENLKKDYEYVCKQLNIENVDLIHKHKTNKEPYQNYFDQETIDLVAESYKEDIDCFGYSYN